MKNFLLKFFLLIGTSFVYLQAWSQSLQTKQDIKPNYFQASLDTIYYNFYGRHPADGNIYGFQAVNYSIQTFSFSYLRSPTLIFSVQARHIRNHAETLFSGTLFKDTTEGLGDTKLRATKTFISGLDLIIADLALSLPTGSISEKNKNNPQYNYPYNMQLGSGTYDLEPMLMYLRTRGQHQLGAMTMAMFRNGRNSYGYRKGNEYVSKVWYTFLADSLLMPGFWLNYHHIQRLSGEDSTYGRNLYVQFYHSPRHFWDFTVNINSQYQLTKILKLKALVASPIWQESKNIDNVQVYAKWFGQLALEGQF